MAMKLSCRMNFGVAQPGLGVGEQMARRESAERDAIRMAEALALVYLFMSLSRMAR